MKSSLTKLGKIFTARRIFVTVAIIFLLGSLAYIYRPVVKEERATEKIPYTTQTEYDANVRSGKVSWKQQGVDGSKEVYYRVTYRNNNEVDRKTVREYIVTEATPAIKVVGTKVYYQCSNGTEYDNIDAKNECERRISWEKGRDQALQECRNDSSKFNCWYDEYPGTTVHWSYYTKPTTTYAPAPTSNTGVRRGAICRDGWTSSATGRGACSHHGGVSTWLYY